MLNINLEGNKNMSELELAIIDLLNVTGYDIESIRNHFIQEEMVEDIEFALKNLINEGYIVRIGERYVIG